MPRLPGCLFLALGRPLLRVSAAGSVVAGAGWERDVAHSSLETEAIIPVPRGKLERGLS
jgi:hypothetical protein